VIVVIRLKKIVVVIIEVQKLIEKRGGGAEVCSLKLLLGNGKMYGTNSWLGLVGECSEELTGGCLCGYFARSW
jgi:hypothetical protein